MCTEQDAVKVKFVVFSAGLNVNMLWNSRELESLVHCTLLVKLVVELTAHYKPALY